MGILLRACLVLAGCLAVLGGVQVPGFVDQYVKRVDARLAESRQNFEPFKQLAQRRHQGSVDALIAHHAQSQDPTFRDEASVIAGLRDRMMYLERHAQSLQVPLHQQLLYLASHSDGTLVDETRAQYSYAVQLDKSSLVSAGVALLAVLIPLELIGGLIRAFRPGRRLRGH